MLIAINSPSRLKLLSFDHIYPLYIMFSFDSHLYGALSSPKFRDIHDYLLRQANASDPQIEYVFRSIRGKTKRQDYDLTGHGVALDLKMDYLALDDRNLGTHSRACLDFCLMIISDRRYHISSI